MRCFFVWLFSTLVLLTVCLANEDDDNWLREAKAKCDSLLAQWVKPENRKDPELRRDLLSAAVSSEQPEIIDQIAADGDFTGHEIKLPSSSRKIVLRAVRTFEGIPSIPYGGRMDVVFRRMTKARFEAWTPKQGWLFNEKGCVINEAHPPRRDGIGREWHGAFLPDGSWITTDLWEMDKTLSFFSRDGKWLKEIKVSDLAPARPDEPWSLDLIGWARCDKKGEGWVLSVGDGPGRAQVYVKPHGKPSLLDDSLAPWKLSYPRDLEPKGMYTDLSRPSDDWTRLIHYSCPGHGSWVGYPVYIWNTDSQGKVIAGGDHNFGFLPGSHDVFIGASDYDYGDENKPRHLRTWFFDEGGKFRGWVRAEFLTDSVDGQATWYCTEENQVVVLDAALKPQTSTRFLVDGKAARALKLFPDLRLGFFCIGKRVILGRW